MTLAVTPLYAIALTLLFIVLAAAVIRRRGEVGAALGAGDDVLLARRVRAHGNFAEYAPLGLLLLLIAELSGVGQALLHLAGVLLLGGRAAHAFAIAREPEPMKARVAGMVATFSSYGVSMVALIWLLLVGAS